MQHLNKKLINCFLNNSFNNNTYIYKVGNINYFVKEIKRWKEIDLQKRESNGNYLFIVRIEIDSNKKKYNFVRQRQFENNIKYVFNLILLNKVYRND